MWERDFEIWLPFSQAWEKGLGDEGIFGLLQEVYRAFTRWRGDVPPKRLYPILLTFDANID